MTKKFLLVKFIFQTFNLILLSIHVYYNMNILTLIIYIAFLLFIHLDTFDDLCDGKILAKYVINENSTLEYLEKIIRKYNVNSNIYKMASAEIKRRHDLMNKDNF